MLEPLIKIIVLIGGLMGAAAYLVLVERWVAAWVQDRRGPNRVGIPLTKIRMFGLGQPVADGVKFVFKEEFTPGHVDKLLYFLAPVAMLSAAVCVFAVVPLGSVLPLDLGAIDDVFGLQRAADPHPLPLSRDGRGEEVAEQPVRASGPHPLPLSRDGRGEEVRSVRLMVAPGLDVGVVYVFALGGVAVYGVLLGGWASNNKYALFGAVRSAAQLISYELPLGTAVLGVVLAAGSLRLDEIVRQQAESGLWNVLVQPLGFIVFLVAAFAEAGRLPFDLPEAEQELVAGYHTEYSGIKLMMYLVADFLHMVAAALLLVVLFLGGWHLWGVTGQGDATTWLQAIVQVAVLVAKVAAVILFFMLARWSWPRFRFDQLMSLAWNVMLPLALVNLVVAAVWNEYGAALARLCGLSGRAAWAMGACGWIVLVGAWAAATLLAAPAWDNRPRRSAVRARERIS